MLRISDEKHKPFYQSSLEDIISLKVVQEGDLDDTGDNFTHDFVQLNSFGKYSSKDIHSKYSYFLFSSNNVLK